MRSSPHDALFKASFGQPDLARSELTLVLPSAVRACLDLRTLTVCPGSFVDEDLRHTHSDLLYGVRTTQGNDGLVYVLFEHQSSPDPTMPFRLLRYVVRVWERWLRDHPEAKTLPIVVPVLLHHGDGAWRASPELAGMLDATPEQLEATRPFTPHFRYLLDDLAAQSPAAIAARSLDVLPRLVQLALWASRSLPRLRDSVPFMRSLTATLVRDEQARALLTQVFAYLLSTAPPDVDVATIRAMLLEVAGPQGREDVMNAGQQLIEQGREEGLEKARAAMRAAITRILGARRLPLSEVGRARVSSCADIDMLTRWVERAATAASEAEVFAGDGTA
jgi:hypothetical protein